MVEIKIPRENANDDVVLIVAVHRVNGDQIARGDVLFEFETSKAAIEFEAQEDGILTDFHLVEGSQVAVDTVVGFVAKKDSPASTEPQSSPQSRQTNSRAAEPVENLQSNASAAAEKLIAAGQKPLRDDRWITSASFSSEMATTTSKAMASKTVAKTVDKQLVPHPFKTIATSARKQAEVRALGVTSSDFGSTIGISIGLGKRRVTNQFFENSILDLLAYETSKLLSDKFSDLNSCHLGDDEIAQFEDVVAGIALDDINNLTVVSLPKIDSLSDLSDAIVDVIIRFEDKKLKGSDLSPSTFTITDLSSTGVNFVLPLINGWQSFILAVARNEDGFMVYGTFDHRVTEGKRFSQFLTELKRRILSYQISNVSGVLDKHCHYCMKSVSQEKKERNRGLLKIDDGEKERLICRNCYEGW